MRHDIGPMRYSTQSHSSQIHGFSIGSNISRGAISVMHARDAHEKAMQADEKRQQQELERQAREAERSELVRQREEERMERELDRIEINRQKAEAAEGMRAYKAELAKTREEIRAWHANERAEIARDNAIDRQINRDVADAFRQQREEEARMRQNEVDIANQAFAQMREENRSNRPGSTKPAISQLEKDAISMLENMGYTKQEATSRVASVYQEGMTAQDLFRAALKG